MQRLQQHRLASCALLIVVGLCMHAHSIWTELTGFFAHCGKGLTADALHVVFECPIFQPLQQQCADQICPALPLQEHFREDRTICRFSKYS